MLIDFHFSNQNIQRRLDISIGFYNYIRDNYNMSSFDVPDMIDPIEFIKNDEGIIFRLKESRDLANWHGLKALDAMNLADETMAMIKHEVVQ